MGPAFSPASPPREIPADHERVASDQARYSLAVVRSIVGMIPATRADARGPPHALHPDTIPARRPGGASRADLRRLFNRSPILSAIGAVVSLTLTMIEFMFINTILSTCREAGRWHHA
jgi:hypothetical protein